MNQRGIAHIFLIIVLAIVGIGAIAYTSFKRESGLSSDITISETPSNIDSSPEESATPVDNTPTAKPTAKAKTPVPTPIVFIDYNHYCGTYSTTQRPPIPARGSAPLIVSLYGSGGVSAGSSMAGFQWDHEGDGTWDKGTVSGPSKYTFSKNGQYEPKFRVVATTGSVGPTCTYPFKVEVTDPKFQNDIIAVDKLNFEYTTSRSSDNSDFPWYLKKPENNSQIYLPAFNVSSKEKFTFIGTKSLNNEGVVRVYESGANLDPGTSNDFHFTIYKSLPNGTYQGSVIVTYTTDNGTVTKDGPTINYKIILTD